ncbi:MAG: hypothetical protein R3E84_15615 [Pseudomonadales bacterium]
MGAPSAPEVLAVIPAAGFGTRFGGAGSKEIYPLDDPADARLIDCLLGHLTAGGVRRALIVTRQGKWDLLQTLGDGASRGLSLAWMVVPPTAGTPFTLDAAHAFLDGQICLLGFPDIVFRATAPVAALLAPLADADIDVVLGLLPTNDPERVDVVVCDGDRVQGLRIKSPCAEARPMTWVLAAWRPAFTHFLHERMADVDWQTRCRAILGREELFVGDVIQAAIAVGLRVHAVPLGATPGVDAGTPEGLVAARQLLAAWR